MNTFVIIVNFIILKRENRRSNNCAKTGMQCTLPLLSVTLMTVQALFQRLSCASFKGRGHGDDLNHIDMNFLKIPANQKKIPH